MWSLRSKATLGSVAVGKLNGAAVAVGFEMRLMNCWFDHVAPASLEVAISTNTVGPGASFGIVDDPDRRQLVRIVLVDGDRRAALVALGLRNIDLAARQYRRRRQRGAAAFGARAPRGRSRGALNSGRTRDADRDVSAPEPPSFPSWMVPNAWPPLRNDLSATPDQDPPNHYRLAGPINDRPRSRQSMQPTASLVKSGAMTVDQHTLQCQEHFCAASGLHRPRAR